MMCESKAYISEVKFKQYTATGSWHDDLDKLHGFRDALGSTGAVVQEAWCLYPAAGVDEQMQPTPPNAEYEPEKSPPGGGVGLLAVHPSDEASWLRLERLLRRWFPDRSVVGLQTGNGRENVEQTNEPGRRESTEAVAITSEGPPQDSAQDSGADQLEPYPNVPVTPQNSVGLPDEIATEGPLEDSQSAEIDSGEAVDIRAERKEIGA